MNCLRRIGFFSTSVPLRARVAGRLGEIVYAAVLGHKRAYEGVSLYAETIETIDAIATALGAVRSNAPSIYRRLCRTTDKVISLGNLGKLKPMMRTVYLAEQPQAPGYRALELAHAVSRLWLFDVGGIPHGNPQLVKIHAQVGERAALRCFWALRTHPIMHGIAPADVKAFLMDLSRGVVDDRS